VNGLEYDKNVHTLVTVYNGGTFVDGKWLFDVSGYDHAGSPTSLVGSRLATPTFKWDKLVAIFNETVKILNIIMLEKELNQQVLKGQC
jgi:hypothetical protein